MTDPTDKRIGTELIRWPFVERSSRKGYMTRNFNVAGKWYRWVSSAVTPEGMLRYGIHDRELHA